MWQCERGQEEKQSYVQILYSAILRWAEVLHRKPIPMAALSKAWV
jgi:hypothetical protein